MLLDSLADIWEIYIFLIVVTDLLENQSLYVENKFSRQMEKTSGHNILPTLWYIAYLNVFIPLGLTKKIFFWFSH